MLIGQSCTWTFEAGAVRIRHERSLKVPKLLQVLGERTIPYTALAQVSLSPGKKGTVVLRAVPRQGADPLMIAAAGQLKEAADPYRLVLPAEREMLAEYYAEEIRRSIENPGPAARCLVAGPPVPRMFKGWDGQASFDGETVRFQWFWSGASSVKYRASDQAFPISQIEGVEWRSPEVFDGHLRLRIRGMDPPGDPAKDPASVVFGMGTGLTHESLPFAAAVVYAIDAARTDRDPGAALGSGTGPALEPGPASATGSSADPEPEAERDTRPYWDPADVAERIRTLGELHRAGLLTDEEFQTKKAELLARL